MTNGKGSTPRPKAVPESEYADNWTRTFCPPLRDPVTFPDNTGAEMTVHAIKINGGEWQLLPAVVASEPDSRELMRQRNLREAERIVLNIRDLAAQAEARATRCHDYPTDT